MTAKTADGQKLHSEQAKKAARQARLEDELRANLQRRKAQVRARKDSAVATTTEAED